MTPTTIRTATSSMVAWGIRRAWLQGGSVSHPSATNTACSSKAVVLIQQESQVCAAAITMKQQHCALPGLLELLLLSAVEMLCHMSSTLVLV